MVIGITGSFGAGKGAVVHYLCSKKNFKHYSASGFITEEIIARNLPVNRDTMTEVGNDLRKKHGPSYIIDTLYRRAKAEGEDAVIESLRAVAEVRSLKSLGGHVIGVSADAIARYKRSVGRNSAKDQVDFETWKKQEKIESDNSDPTKQNIFKALEESDTIIENNGSLKELRGKIETFLKTVE